MTTVSQEAREAYLSMNMLPEFDAADVRAGRWDNTTGLQAFAKFEQSIRQQAERGEVVAWMYEKNGRVLLDHGPTCSDDMVSGGWAAVPLYTLPTPPEAV